MNTSEKNLRQMIEEKITHGDVTKKARWYFIVRRIIIITAGILALCLAVYLGSFIFFLVNDQGIGLLTDFGWEGAWELFTSLPWIIIGLIILLIIIIELVGWRFTRLYRQPFIYSILGTLVIILLAGTLLERTHLHRALFDSAEHNQLPVAGYFYHQFGRPAPHNIHFGVIINQKPEEWDVETREGIFMVIITNQTHFPRGKNIIPHDRIIIIGPANNNTITAHGIRKITPETMPKFFIRK
jgi:hypothetical protein